MKQFRTILGFELKSFFKNKVFIGVTVFLMIAIAAVMFYPRLTASLHHDSAPETKPRMLVCLDAAEDASDTGRLFAEAFPDYEVEMVSDDIAQLQKRIVEGGADCAFVITGPTAYRYFVNNLSMYDQNIETADKLLKRQYQSAAMARHGFSAEQADEVLSVGITHETQSLGKDQTQNFFYTYVMIFALYMVILLYGQLVATNVASEKSSRAMELLITSAKPRSMMFGKVIASCIAGLLQLICVFGSAFVFFQINKSDWAGTEIINSIFNIPMGLLGYMMLFFVLGFFLYAFMYGAVGSTASKLEDINTSVMPITLLFIIAFMVVMFSMSSGNVDNTLMRICAYVPFTSPMAMFTRIAMSTVPFYEIVISVVILLASVFGVGVISAKIYRVGVLLYGTTPKIGAVLKAVWKA